MAYRFSVTFSGPEVTPSLAKKILKDLKSRVDVWETGNPFDEDYPQVDKFKIEFDVVDE